MIEILESILSSIEDGKRVALSSIVAGHGSLPMSRRSKMLLLDDGTQRGTVGGGCLEAEVHALSAQAMRGGGATLRRFTLTESQAGAEGLNCGGTVEILVEPLGGGADAGAERAVYRAALDALAAREETVLATVVAGRGTEWRVIGRGIVGWKGMRSATGVLSAEGEPAVAAAVTEECQAALGQDRAAWITLPPAPGGEERRALLETLDAPPTLYLFGGGHVSLAVARVARLSGFRIVVVDDRPAFSNPERFPEADRTLVLPMDTAFRHLDIDDGSYIVAVTRGHQHDEPVIEQAIRTPAAYIGMLGSRRKVAIMWKRLRERGATEEALARVHAPIGLPIGADSPGEIAVSIVAQLIGVRRSRAGRKGVSETPGPAGEPSCRE